MQITRKLAFLLAVCLSIDVSALGPDEPCSNPETQDTTLALFASDEYAWKLFVELNQPGDIETKCADPTKAFGADGPVVWETWRNVRNDAEDTVFRPDASDPGSWRAKFSPNVKSVEDFVSRPLKQAAALTVTDFRNAEAASVFADAAVGEGNEVRLNRSAYQFIRNEGLYSRQKQIDLVQQGKLNLNFPKDAKEVKAQWRRIQMNQRDRYHWTIFVKEDGSREVWGLTAMHITTKDTPNWFWATFEHVDNEQAGPLPNNVRANEGWLIPSVDRFACEDSPYDCNEFPRGLGLKDTKWENYRLRGTQVDFVDSTGRDTVLSNSQIEQGFQQSSCITCHAMAARDRNGNMLRMTTQSGTPNSRLFVDRRTGKQNVMQLDFVWSLDRAR